MLQPYKPCLDILTLKYKGVVNPGFATLFTIDSIPRID